MQLGSISVCARIFPPGYKDSSPRERRVREVEGGRRSLSTGRQPALHSPRPTPNLSSSRSQVSAGGFLGAWGCACPTGGRTACNQGPRLGTSYDEWAQCILDLHCQSGSCVHPSGCGSLSGGNCFGKLLRTLQSFCPPAACAAWCSPVWSHWELTGPCRCLSAVVECCGHRPVPVA